MFPSLLFLRAASFLSSERKELFYDHLDARREEETDEVGNDCEIMDEGGGKRKGFVKRPDCEALLRIQVLNESGKRLHVHVSLAFEFMTVYGGQLCFTFLC